MPVGNLKVCQCFYGGIDAQTGELHLATYPKAEMVATTNFLTQLMYRYPKAKLTMGWDNARWHRGDEVRRCLATVNSDRPLEEWRITRIAFAPHDRRKILIEEVWRQSKTDRREQRLDVSQFSEVTAAFETRLERHGFDFPKLKMDHPS